MDDIEAGAPSPGLTLQIRDAHIVPAPLRDVSSSMMKNV